MKILTVLAMALVVVGSVDATVITGPITDLPDAKRNPPYFEWGDGLYMDWSVRHTEGGDGWFYGCGEGAHRYGPAYAPPYSNVEIAVVTTTHPETVNPLTLIYTWKNLAAYEGDSVFAWGLNGRYGYWRIDDIVPDVGTPYNNWNMGFLSGEWGYFPDLYTPRTFEIPPVVPEPAGILLLGAGLLGVIGLGRKVKK